MEPQPPSDHPNAPTTGLPTAERSPEITPDADDTDVEWDLTDPFVDNPAEATDRMLEVIAAVDFLRRGDRRGITLWAAVEEALRWWVAEPTALLDGYTDGHLEAPRLGEPEILRSTLLRLIAVAGQDEPVHINQALQEALRHWSSTMADRHNEGHPWPAPAPRRQGPIPLRLVPWIDTAAGEPPDLIA
jgi:hypothetical protein